MKVPTIESYSSELMYRLEDTISSAIVIYC